MLSVFSLHMHCEHHNFVLTSKQFILSLSGENIHKLIYKVIVWTCILVIIPF